MKTKSIFILGASGFIGSHAVGAFHGGGWEVTALDLRRGMAPLPEGIRFLEVRLPSETLAEELRAARPRALLFAAGNGRVRESLGAPLQDFRESVATYVSVLDAVRRETPGTRVLFLSSAAVYGNPPEVPVREEAPLRPLSPYGYHKVMCELASEEYRGLYGLDVTCARIFSAFGPGLRRQVVWDIASKVLRPGCAAVHLRGNGEETRDFLHVQDLCAALRRCAEGGAPPPPVLNVSSGTEVSIRHLAEEIHRLLGSSKPLGFSGERDEGMPIRWCADVRKAREMGILPDTSLEARLGETLRWIRGQGPWEEVP